MDLNLLLGVGTEPKDLTILQVVLRGMDVFWAALFMVHIADKRFMAKLSAFDVILGFYSGLVARMINGSGPLNPTLVSALVLVLLHRALSKLTCWSAALERVVKGKEVRLNGSLEDIARVRVAMLERNGKISIVEKD